MRPPQNWMSKVLDCLDGCLEWHAPGAMAFAITEDGELLLAPAGCEIKGGRHDGESVYPLFTLDVSELVSVFDAPPLIFWHTHDIPSISFDGKIDDEDVMLMVFSRPFPGDEHRFRVYQDGSFGPD